MRSTTCSAAAVMAGCMRRSVSRPSIHKRTMQPSWSSRRASRQHTPASPKLSTTRQKMSHLCGDVMNSAAAVYAASTGEQRSQPSRAPARRDVRESLRMAREINLNGDMGESFGRYSIGDDEALIELVKSASIACGFHAGDPSVMARSVALAKAHGVSVGAHPSFPDLQGFGRRAMRMRAAEIEPMVAYQIGALQAIAAAQ